MGKYLLLLIAIISFSFVAKQEVKVGHVDLIGHNQQTLETYLNSNGFNYKTNIIDNYVDYYVSTNVYFRVGLESKLVEGIAYLSDNKENFETIKQAIYKVYNPVGEYDINGVKSKFVAYKGTLGVFCAEIESKNKNMYNTIFFFAVERDFK